MIIRLVLFYILICTGKIKSIVRMSKLCLDVNFCHEDSRKRVLKILPNVNTVSGTSLEPVVFMFLSSLGVKISALQTSKVLCRPTFDPTKCDSL